MRVIFLTVILLLPTLSPKMHLARLRSIALCSNALRPSGLPLLRSLASGFTGLRQANIERRLIETFAPVYLEVLNESHGRAEDESHFKVVIVSDSFDGKRLINRHRLVNNALLDASGALPFHSLSVASAKTPAEWGEDSTVGSSPRCVGGDGRGIAR